MLRPILRTAGIRPDQLKNALLHWFRYAKDRKAFRGMMTEQHIPLGRDLPILGEWNRTSGELGAYFHQDQLVARWIYELNPERHVDIGSRIDGFIGNLAVFREVEVIDVRPQMSTARNIRFHQLDLMEELPPHWIGVTSSLSCLHTIEHFGLGRYGDKLDPDGHLNGLAQITRMINPGGRLYLSTPVGRERVEFNAHRIFSVATVLSWFLEGWSIERSAVIDDELHVTESDGSEALREAVCDTGVGILCARKA